MLLKGELNLNGIVVQPSFPFRPCNAFDKEIESGDNFNDEVSITIKEGDIFINANGKLIVKGKGSDSGKRSNIFDEKIFKYLGRNCFISPWGVYCSHCCTVFLSLMDKFE